MKINIINENKIISTKINQNTKVRELLSYLKSSDSFKNLYSGKYSEMILMDTSSKIINEEEIIKIEKQDANFYLIIRPCYGAVITDKIDVEETITLITGGRTKIKKSPKKGKDSLSSRLQLLEQMSNSLGVLQTNNPLLQNRVSEINHFRNLLRSMISEIPQIRVPTQPQAVVADEIMLGQLKDMGFPEESCRRALVLSRNNISRATDLLINDELDYVQSENNATDEPAEFYDEDIGENLNDNYEGSAIEGNSFSYVINNGNINSNVNNNQLNSNGNQSNNNSYSNSNNNNN